MFIMDGDGDGTFFFLFLALSLRYIIILSFAGLVAVVTTRYSDVVLLID